MPDDSCLSDSLLVFSITLKPRDEWGTLCAAVLIVVLRTRYAQAQIQDRGLNRAGRRFHHTGSLHIGASRRLELAKPPLIPLENRIFRTSERPKALPLNNLLAFNA